MTIVNITFTLPDGGIADPESPAQGRLIWQPVGAAARRGATGPDRIILPAPFEVALQAGVTSVEVAACAAVDGWCWAVREDVPQGILRHVLVPEAGPVHYRDLVDVNPNTLAGVTAAPAAWTLAIESLTAEIASAQGHEDAAQAAAASASASAATAHADAATAASSAAAAQAAEAGVAADALAAAAAAAAPTPWESLTDWVGPGQRVAWTDGNTWRNASGAWLPTTATPETWPQGWAQETGLPAVAWAAGQAVEVGDLRTYGGKTYRCIQAHTTQAGWTPPSVAALWAVQG